MGKGKLYQGKEWHPKGWIKRTRSMHSCERKKNRIERIQMLHIDADKRLLKSEREVGRF